MTTWPNDWSVVVEDALDVRAYNGQSSRWYHAAMRQKAGRVSAAGITKEVTFESADAKIGDRIDDAYRAKYKGSPVSEPDDRHTRPLSDGEIDAARELGRRRPAVL